MVTDSRAVPRRASRSPDPTSSVSVMQHKSGPWTVIAVAGDMDIQVLGLVPAAPESQAGRVVFDLSRVTFMDAAGFGAIIGYESMAHQAGGSTRLVGPSVAVRRILRMTGTTQLFTTFGSLDAALSAPL